MLLEFKVRNYKSIADTQKFSLVSGKSSGSKDRRSLPTGNSFASNALRTATLFGANGAGKSSLLEALGFYSHFVENSAKSYTADEEIPMMPFKLRSGLEEEPSEFEAIFIHESSLYQYGFSLDKTRVIEEWLFSRPNESGTRMRTLFQRAYSKDEGSYVWDVNETYVKGERETWKKSTRENALFLSTAVQLNSSSLKPPYDWIADYLVVLPSPDNVSPHFTAKLCLDDDEKPEVLRFLKSTDINIEDISIEEKELKFPKRLEELMTEAGLKTLREGAKNSKTLESFTFHKNDEGNLIRFDLGEESSGTQVLFALAGPIMDVLQNGYTLFVDELHTSLHPIALRHLVDMFHDPKTNIKGAQLVFTTHDTTVLSGGLMHKDQIWLIEKNLKGASHLYPLSDFDIRDSQSFARGYLNGQFGGLPHPVDFEFGEE